MQDDLRRVIWFRRWLEKQHWLLSGLSWTTKSTSNKQHFSQHWFFFFFFLFCMLEINSTFNYMVTQHKIWASVSISTVSSYPLPCNLLNLLSAKYGFHWISPSSQLQPSFRRLVIKVFQNRKCERQREKKAETIIVPPITFEIHHPMIQHTPRASECSLLASECSLLAPALPGLCSALLAMVIVPRENVNSSLGNNLWWGGLSSIFISRCWCSNFLVCMQGYHHDICNML